MADATAAIDTPQKLTKFDQNDRFGMATSATIYEGTGVAIGSDGKLVHASQAGATYTLGIAQETVTTAAAGTLISVTEGIFRMANDAGHLLTIANRLGPCYWTDDQTVGTDNTKLEAGVVYDVDASGVWVIMGPCLVTAIASGALLSANNLSDVANAATSAHNLGLGTADTPTFTGVKSTTGGVTGVRVLATKTATYTVDVPANDGNIVIQDLTDNAVITLPAVAAGNKGHVVTLINTAASGAAKVSLAPNAADGIYGTVGAVSSSGTDNKAWNNTKATALKGDYTTLVSDGVNGWWIIGGVGVWASTP